MAANDLTTVQTVKDHLSLASPDADALLARLITDASSAIQRYLNRDVIQKTYTEIRDGMGGSRMLLRQYPAQEPTSVVVDDLSIPKRTTALGGGWAFDGNRVLGLSSGYTFTRGFGNVVITYTAGYAPGSIPLDIEQACVEMVALTFRQRNRIGDASKTVSAGGGHETVAFFMGAMTAGTRERLDQFSEVVPT